jgi:hypothetical protein
MLLSAAITRDGGMLFHHANASEHSYREGAMRKLDKWTFFGGKWWAEVKQFSSHKIITSPPIRRVSKAQDVSTMQDI